MKGPVWQRGRVSDDRNDEGKRQARDLFDGTEAFGWDRVVLGGGLILVLYIGIQGSRYPREVASMSPPDGRASTALARLVALGVGLRNAPSATGDFAHIATCFPRVGNGWGFV